MMCPEKKGMKNIGIHFDDVTQKTGVIANLWIR
jgi:hypothetical protein